MKISYAQLSAEDKITIQDRLEHRRAQHRALLNHELKEENVIIIVGDRPGPSAPRIAGYHHTPFYSVRHCSGWLNAALHMACIPEQKLVWVNSADENGVATSSTVLQVSSRCIIALGGAAASWLKKSGINEFVKVPHPQFWKRFKNSQPYELIDILRQLN